MPDIYLYAGEASATDILLADPTILRSGAGTIDGTIDASQGQSAVLAMDIQRLLRHRVVRGDDPLGFDDWWCSYYG